MYDIAFYEAFQEERAAIKKYLPTKIRAWFTVKTIQESSLSLPSRLISIRTQSILPLSWATQLDGILTRSTGYDHISAYRQRVGRNLPAGYLPNYCARSVAEQSILMLMMLWRKMHEQEQQISTFNRDTLTGQEVLDKKLLVLGVGYIGKEIVNLSQGLGMNVRGVDLVRKIKSIKYVSLETGVRWADAIVCSLPLTTKTTGMLDYRSLKKAKSGTVLINISRGEITPLKDLQRLLAEKKLGGLGLDVYENEGSLASFLRTRRGKAPQEWKTLQDLRRRSNVVLTPHNAFNTSQALERKAEESVQAVVQFLKRKSFPSPVPRV